MEVFSKIDNFVTNLKFPWERNKNLLLPLSSIDCYIQKNLKEFIFEKIWSRKIFDQVF